MRWPTSTGDGRLDIVTANLDDNSVSVLLNGAATTQGPVFILDTNAPAAPDMALASDTGSSASDKITSNGALTVTGAEAGAIVQYSIDGGTAWTSSFTAVEGANSVQVRQTDVAGNVSAASTAFTFTLDTLVAAPSLALASDTGVSSTDKITSNGALTVTGAEAGAIVQYSIDGGTAWTSSFTAVEGANSMQVRQTDVAGNVSAASAALVFTLDTLAPAAPLLALASDTGAASTDKITSNGALAVSGVEATVGTLVEYSINGGTIWTTAFTATEGANSVQARQTDLAGNVSAASAALVFTLDTMAPAAPGVALASDTGVSATDRSPKPARCAHGPRSWRLAGIFHQRRHHLDHRLHRRRGGQFGAGPANRSGGQCVAGLGGLHLHARHHGSRSAGAGAGVRHGLRRHYQQRRVDHLGGRGWRIGAIFSRWRHDLDRRLCRHRGGQFGPGAADRCGGQYIPGFIHPGLHAADDCAAFHGLRPHRRHHKRRGRRALCRTCGWPCLPVYLHRQQRPERHRHRPNEFIHTGSGFDAIDVSAAGGNNVLDGGTNSNFLVGGTKAGTSDTFSSMNAGQPPTSGARWSISTPAMR